MRALKFRTLIPALWLLVAWLAPGPGLSQARRPEAAPAQAAEPGDGLVQLDFNDVELSVVIDTIARLTSKNFIYDDRVRGRVTIVSPTKITVEQAYAVFESVLQVKGFTTVEGPGGAIKVIPIREAKESSIETVRGRTPESDRFITRLIPLRFIDAEAIANTLKPLVSKDASLVAYAATNTVILTDSASNIRRLLDILESIDVETYKEELTVIQLEHADAATLAQQISEIYGAEVSGTTTPAVRRRARRVAAQAPTEPSEKVRIVTDERTNSLIVLASRSDLEDVRRLISRLDVPIRGGGRIHVYYLKNADAEEMAETLNALISGQPAPSAARGAQAQTPAQPLRAAVMELAEGITVTADVGTNSLVIQASKEGFNTLSQVIEQLDIQRPQVLVEALIMEVDVSNNQSLGFNGIARVLRGDTSYAIASVPGGVVGNSLGGTGGGGGDGDGDGDGNDLAGALAGAAAAGDPLLTLLAAVTKDTRKDTDGDGVADDGSLIASIITASAGNADMEILSAPHILTTDNEEAEIKVGANIPIITSRVQSAQGVTQATDTLATSVNVERQDIGVTLRVTPQISEGNNVRLDIFQEITNINNALSRDTGDPEQVGVSLSNRKVENTVVVANAETVVIGGLISDDYSDVVNKVPWLGDIPVLGWLFKSTSRSLVKTNLLVFLTPHIVRSADDLEGQTIRKREELRGRSRENWEVGEGEREEEEERLALAQEVGIETDSGDRDPVRSALSRHEKRYPLERMREIEEKRREERAREAETSKAAPATRYGILVAVFRDETRAAETLTELVDAGYEGTLVSDESGGAVLHEIRLGPYETLKEAEEAASVVRSAFGLAPSVLVERPEP